MNAREAPYSLLSDRELLEKLIGVRQSRRVYHGLLDPLFCADAKPGSPEEKCRVARELTKRWLEEEIRRGAALSSPGAVRDYLRVHFAGQEHESFVTLFLDAQHRVIEASELFRGTLTQTSVYPREIVKEALRHNAGAVILAHNHPSGVAEPSGADEALTRALKEALALIDVRVLDHFVVAGPRVMSFAERGLL